MWGGATVQPPDAAPDGARTVQNDGSAYVPASTAGSRSPAPLVPRSGAESAWTGSRLVITGGYHEGDDDDRTDGAAFDPVSGAWSPIAARPTPGSVRGRQRLRGALDGKVRAVPTSPGWPTTPPPTAGRPSPPPRSPKARPPANRPSGPAPPAQSGASPGRTLGRRDAPPTGTAAAVYAGAMYDPAANRWQTFVAGPLSGRVRHTAVWTGQEMLVWGGSNGDAGLADGAAYRPSRAQPRAPRRPSVVRRPSLRPRPRGSWPNWLMNRWQGPAMSTATASDGAGDGGGVPGDVQSERHAPGAGRRGRRTGPGRARAVTPARS